MEKYKDCAAVYVATGEKYIEEAIHAAQSLRDRMPSLKIILHSDRAVESSLFQEIHTIEQPLYSFIDKTCCYKHAREGRLLFLDTDTFIAEPLYEIFDLLERFDLVFCHAPWRLSWDEKTHKPWQIEGIPPAFCEPNTGVIAFRNIPRVHDAFERWKELFKIHQQRGAVMHDQPAFRQCIWESDLAFYIMPPEYNSRLIFPTFINGTVKVVHARFDDPEKIVKQINSVDGHKIFDPYSRQVFREKTFKRLSLGFRKRIFKFLS